MIPQLFSTVGHAFGLTAGGIQLADYLALEVAPVRWEMAGEAQTGGMSFVIEDDGRLTIPDGVVVRFTDNVNGRLLSAGVLVNQRHRRGPGGLQTIECNVAGWGLYLDRRHVWHTWTWDHVANGYSSAFDMIAGLVRSYGGPISAIAPYVAGGVEILGGAAEAGLVTISPGTTLRAGIEAILAWSDSYIETDPPQYSKAYVDENAMLHQYGSIIGNPQESSVVVGEPPCRIGDGSYVRDILTTSGLSEYWLLHDAASGTSKGALAATAMTWTGAVTPEVDLGVTIGVINEPGYRSVLLDGTTSKGTVASGALTGTGDWSFECWFRHAAAITGTDTIYSGTAASSPLIRMLSTGKLDISLKGGASEAASLTAWNDDEWHHLVVVHEAGVGGRIRIDGVDDTGTMVSRSFSASSGCTIGADGSSDYWAGYLQHVAIYGVALGSGGAGGSVLLLFGGGGVVEVGSALAHYRQGITYAPDELMYEAASDQVTGAAYVYDVTDTALGWTTYGTEAAGTMPYWDAGSTNAVFTGVEAAPYSSKTDAEVALEGARQSLYSQAPILSVTFTAIGLHGWRPGQALSIKDARLTGGAWETHIIRSVSAELFEGSNIIYHITTGAPARSLVQAVAG